MYYYFFLICKSKLYQIYWVSYIWTHILCFSHSSTAPTNLLFSQLVYWVLFLLNFSEAGLISSLFCTILSFCTKLLPSTKNVWNISHLIKKNPSLDSSSPLALPISLLCFLLELQTCFYFLHFLFSAWIFYLNPHVWLFHSTPEPITVRFFPVSASCKIIC